MPVPSATATVSKCPFLGIQSFVLPAFTNASISSDIFYPALLCHWSSLLYHDTPILTLLPFRAVTLEFHLLLFPSMSKVTAQGALNSAKSGYAPEEMQNHVAHFILLVVFSSFATAAVGLRFWARNIRTQTFALHDYLTVLGLVSIPQASRIKPYPLMMDDRRSSHSPRLVSIFIVGLFTHSNTSLD